MSNLERSNFVLARILNLAMENGISHWSMSFSDLDLDEEYATHFFPCIQWLEAEGLIRVGAYSRSLGGYANGSVQDIALTSLGMAVLGQKVTIDGTSQDFEETIKDVSEGRVDYNRIGDAIGGILGGLIKSLGS